MKSPILRAGEGVFLTRTWRLSSERSPRSMIETSIATSPAAQRTSRCERRSRPSRGCTKARTLTAFDIGADGSLSNQRAWADLDDGVPDGICVDAEGPVWYGDVPNKRCVRVREGG